MTEQPNTTPSQNGQQKVRIATTWLDGCSGCHMSFLDIDERIIAIAPRIELVYSPLVDLKHYPNDVDVCLIEGAVSSTDDLKKVKMIRERTRILVSLGDCAVTANVPSLRNAFKVPDVYKRAYQENTERPTTEPWQVVPALLDRVRPVHTVVKVDVYVPGCPPSADVIFYVVSELLEGRMPDLKARTRFGA